MNRSTALAHVMRDPTREALAAAIAAVPKAERDLQAAHDAVQRAMERKFDAIHSLEAITDGGQDAEEGPGAGSAFLDSIAAGTSCDVDVLERAVAQRPDKIKRLEREVETWRNTQRSCEAMIPAREADLERARLAVDKARRDVIRNASAAVRGLLAGLDRLQAEVFDRRLQLHFFAVNDLIPENDKAAVTAALEQKMMPGDNRAVFYNEWHSRPLYLAWMNAFEALKRDAEATLPGTSSTG